MHKGKKLGLLVLSAVSLITSSPPVFAESALPAESLDESARQILLDEIKLAKLNTDWHKENPQETPLHKWSSALLSTAAYSVADAGNIVTFTNAFLYRNKPQSLSRRSGEAGPFLIFLGEILFFSRTMSAMTLDTIQHFQLGHRGFDRKTFEKKASALETDLNQRLTARRLVCEQSGDELVLKEQAVLEDIAHSASHEFVTNYARGAKLQAFRIADNIMSDYTSSTGAFWGGLLIFLAAKQKRPRLVGPAGIGFMASGGGFILGKIVARAASKGVERHLSAKMLARRPGASASALEKLKTDRETLAKMGTSPLLTSSDFANRQSIYDRLVPCFENERHLEALENNQHRR